MMTKYQIVFLKLETSLFNIVETERVRRQMRIKRAFLKMKQNRDDFNTVSNQRKRLAVLKFECNLGKMCNVLQRYRLKQVAVRGFVKWNLFTKMQAQSSKL